MSRPKKKRVRGNSEVTKLVNKVKRRNDEESFNALLKHFQEYIHHTSYKFFIRGCDITDIVQECYIALRYKAIPDYDEKKGDFLSFGRMCIKRHIITQLKSGNKKRNTALNTALSLDNVSSDENDDGITFLSYLNSRSKTPTHETIKKETRNVLFKRLKVELTDLEKKVFELFCSRMSYTDIAKKLRVSGIRRANEKLVDNAIARMKKKAIDIYKTFLRDEL